MGFLVGPLAIAGVAGLLAVIIAIVDSAVNNYGEVEIGINGDARRLAVGGGRSLLTTLAEEKIFIPSACGGRGSCGACTCQVITDIGPHLPTEIPYLSMADQKKNMRLSCQIKVKTDLQLQIPDELFNVKEYRGKVLSLKDLTHDIKELLIDLGEQEITFTAGMYMQVVVYPYAKIKGVTQRAYSLSSVPSDKRRVELLIRLVPGGVATTYVHHFLQEGGTIDLIGPFGEFRRTQSNNTMICIAGGSGMAPIKSILYDMYEKREQDRDIWYFFGAVYSKDMFYLELMRDLADKWERFHFVPALSCSPQDPDWEGETGLITDVLDRYLGERISHDAMKEGYLCGSPGMIDACIRVLAKHDIPGERIYYDKFA